MCRTRPFFQIPAGRERAPIKQVLRPSPVQGKRTISQPNDNYEQEADWFTDQVMRMPETKVQRPFESEDEVVGAVAQAKFLTSPLILRQAIFPTKEISDQITMVTGAVQVRMSVLQGAGHPLPDNERDFFEPRFGHDS